MRPGRCLALSALMIIVLGLIAGWTGIFAGGGLAFALFIGTGNV